MSVLGDIIKARTPKFNRVLAEGISYHKTKNACEWIDNLIKFTVANRTNTFLNYLGCRVLTPEELFVLKFKGNPTNAYDLAPNSVYGVEYTFQYEGCKERKEIIYLPYMEKGNLFLIGGKDKIIMPTLADKVISVGKNNIFIDIILAKYTFTRMQFPIVENGMTRNVPIILTEMYRNQQKKFKDTTKCKSTPMLYLLCNYGYSKTMEALLGFVPIPTYDDQLEDGYIIYGSTGLTPKGWNSVNPNKMYPGNKIRFKIPVELDNPEVIYTVGNVLYILDHFVGKMDITQLDDKDVWTLFLGEIILTAEHGALFRLNQMGIHFRGLMKEFELSTKRKLLDLGINADHVIELLFPIFQNYNKWVAQGTSKSLYHRKSLEVESFVLRRITSNFARFFFDLSKIELKQGNKPVDEQEFNKLCKQHLRQGAVFGLRKDKHYVQSVENSTNSIILKNTTFLVMQEGNFTNITSGKSNTSTKHPLSASMATFGSFLNLSKDNPNPAIRLNPYGNIDPVDSTILPIEDLKEIVDRTEDMLSNVHTTNGVVDISDENPADLDNDDYEMIIEVDELEVNDFENDD